MTIDAAQSNRPTSNIALAATAASIGVALTLIGAKLFAWMQSGSVGMLASLADSSLDLAASAIAFAGVRWAAHPADKDHRFGHAKAESVSSLIQAVIIIGSAAFVAREAILRLMNPEPLTASGLAIAVMALSIVLTAGLALFQTIAVRRTGSLAVEADRAHYLGDLASNIGILIALFLAATFGWLRADAIAGLAVAALLGWSAVQILGKTLPQLMDAELSPADRKAIIGLATNDPTVKGAHALRTRRAGGDVFIQLHLELDPQMPLETAHGIADAAEARVRAAFPGADVIIHLDPHGVHEPHDAFGRPL